MIWLCYIIMLVVPYLLAGINTSIIVAKVNNIQNTLEGRLYHAS